MRRPPCFRTLDSYQLGRFAHSIVGRLFGSVHGKRIALLGFAFKKDTGDVRESPAAYVAAWLLAERAQLRAHDPKAQPAAMALETQAAAEALGLGLDLSACGLGQGKGQGQGQGQDAGGVAAAAPLFTVHAEAYAACEGAHAVVVLTEWPCFRELDWRRIYAACAKPAWVFDGRNLLDAAALREIGFGVQGIGKPAASAAGPGLGASTSASAQA